MKLFRFWKYKWLWTTRVFILSWIFLAALAVYMSTHVKDYSVIDIRKINHVKVKRRWNTTGCAFVGRQNLSHSKLHREAVSQTFQTNQSDPRKKNNSMILLLAYLRGGSTFTADIIQQARGVFFLFEPFMYFTPDYYHQTDSLCHFVSGACRKPLKKLENTSFIVETLKNLFACDLLGMNQKMFRAFKVTSDRSYVQYDLMNCIRKETSRKICLLEFERKCELSTTRVVKVLRLSATLMSSFFEEYPSFKIIHLLRDPRGMILSRQIGGYSRSRNVINHAEEICARYVKDIKILTGLNKRFPGRIKSILYEAIAEDPILAAQNLYKFLDLEFTPNVTQFIHKKTNATRDGGFYNTIRKNSTETAYHWRNKLYYGHVREIDVVCKELYDIVGYMSIPTVGQLKNFSFKPRKNTKDFGNYLLKL